MNTEEKFEFTTDGYLKAKEFLIEIGEFERISHGGFSTDGHSIVDAANVWHKRVDKKIPNGANVTIKSGDLFFYSVISSAEWDFDQWVYLIDGSYYCESEVEITDKCTS